MCAAAYAPLLVVTSCQRFAALQDRERRVAASFTGAVWPRKGRSRSARDKKCAARVRTKSAPPAHLGAGAKEICPYPRDCARSQDDQQKWRLRGPEKGRGYREVNSRSLCRISLGHATHPSQIEDS